MAIQLNPNMHYLALSNMIINLRLYDYNVAKTTLSDMLKEDVGLFGDKVVKRAQDILGSYEWQGDDEAARLLQVNRNKTQKEQVLTISKFRQCNVSTDKYLSKQAWEDASAFSDFSSQLIEGLQKEKKVHDEGIVRTFVGTAVSSQVGGNIEIEKPTAGANDTQESINRLTAQKVAKAFADLKVDMEDNTRDYNDYGYINAVNFDDLIIVYNADVYNDILYTDLPTIFHNDNIKPKATFVAQGRYFGTVNAGEATGNTATRATADGRTVAGKGQNGAIRSLGEQDINNVNYKPADAIANGVKAPAGSTYTQKSDKVIAKVFTKEAVPFLSAFDVGTQFTNPRSLTETNFLTWGYAPLELIKAQPFVTISFKA